MRPNGPDGKPDSPAFDPAPDALALMALVWILGDGQRADRLLALTGLNAGTLRAGIGDPAVLGAVLGFLADHEPDLIACAEDIGTTPAALIVAKERLTR